MSDESYTNAVIKEREEFRAHLLDIAKMTGNAGDIGAAWEGVAAILAHQAELVRELAACQRVLHMMAHCGEVTPEYADEAKKVLDRTPTTSLAEVRARAIEDAAINCAPVNPQTGEKVPVWIGMVLVDYANRIRKEAK